MKMKKLIATLKPTAPYKDIIELLMDSTVDLQIVDVEKADEQEKKLYSPKRFPGKTTWSVIMEHYSTNAEFTNMQASEWLKKIGYDGKSASPSLSVLVKEGYVKRLSQNTYKYVKPFTNGQLKPYKED